MTENGRTVHWINFFSYFFKEELMKHQKLTVVLMLLVLALFVGCSLNVPQNEQNDASKTALSVRRIDKESGFMTAASALSDGSATSIVLNDQDKVSVIVEIGDGLAAKYINGGYASFADLYNSEEGLALVAEMNAARASAMTEVAALGADLTDAYTYGTLLNGFSAVIEFGKIDSVAALDCVKSVVISEEYSAPEFTVSSVDELFGKDGIFDNETQYKGEGIIAAVIDTGLDYDHDAFQKEPDFQIMTLESLERVYQATNAYSYVRSGVASYYVSGKIPFAFDYADKDFDVKPSDYAGQNVEAAPHGTHVAGIIAGNNDEIQGAACNAQLAIMKVFSDNGGGANNTTIVAALEDCITLGVDMANLSLGTACGFSVARDGSAEFMNKVMLMAEKAGLSVFCASGNFNTANHDTSYNSLVLNGNPDNGVIGAPASYRPTISVGSVNSVTQLVVEVDNGSKSIQLFDSVDADSNPYSFVSILGEAREKTFEYVLVPGFGAESDYEGIDVTGKIAVVSRGETTFESKQLIASQKGAIGCIIVNTGTENTRAQIINLAIPTVMVSLTSGDVLKNATVKNITVTEDSLLYVRSYFSSMGAVTDCSIGVDLMGVGGSVYSSVLHSYAVAQGLTSDYATMSGTSMASPNVTGVAAALTSYLKQTYPEKTGAEIRDLVYALLMSTADVVKDENGHALSPRMQGAGVADLYNAIGASAYLKVANTPQPKLSLGSDVEKDGVYTLRFSVVNFGEDDITYTLSAEAYSESTSKGYILGQPYAFDDASFVMYADGELLEGSEITVKAGETLSLKVVVTLTDADKEYMDANFANGIYVEGFVYLKTDDDADLSIPYMAFYGDWYGDMPIFDGVNGGEMQIAKTTPSYNDRYTYEDSGLTLVIPRDFTEFPYAVADGYSKPANSDKFIGINKTFGVETVNIAFLRNVTNCGLYFKDAVTDEVFLWGEFGAANKAYSYYGSQPIYVQANFPTEQVVNADNYGFANNQRLVLELFGTFEEKTTQTLTWNIFVDYEAPTILKAEKEEKDGKTYLNLNAYDNGTIIALKLYTENNGTAVDLLANTVIPLSDTSVAGADNSYSIDITPYLANVVDNKLIVEVVDSARNTSSYAMDLTGAEENTVNVINSGLVDTTSAQVSYISSEMFAQDKDAKVSAYDPSKPEFEVVSGTLVSYNGEGGDVVIPDNLGIFSIGANAFYLNDTITSVVIPKGVITIGEAAFKRCYNMTKVVLSSTVRILSAEAFYGCVKLEDINLEDASVTVYNRMCLGGTKSLKKVTIPDVNGQTVTMAGAFQVCIGLEEIVVNANLGMCTSEFLLCPDLKKITFNGTIRQLGSACFNYLESLEELEFNNTVGQIGQYVYISYGNRYILLYTACGLPSLKKVTFRADVDVISALAFNSCPNLESVTFYGKIPEKNLSAFGNCPKLADGFTLGEGNDRYIKDEKTNAIYNLDKTKLYSPNCWEPNGEYVLPETITSLDARMFGDSSLIIGTNISSVSVSDTGAVDFVGMMDTKENDISRTKFTSIVLHDGITAIPDECFSNNINLTFDLSNITSFGKYCLRNTGFTSIVLGDNVTDIDYVPWRGCRNLTELSISEKTKVSAFYGWYAGTGFTTIEVPSYINVNEATYLAQGAQNVTEIIIPEGTTVLPAYFADSCPNLVSVKNTEAVESILTGAFSFCTSLKSIDLPNVKSIATAFYGCTSLEYANYGDDLTSLGSMAFKNCSSLKKVYYPARLTANVNDAFDGCTGVEEYVVASDNPAYASDEYGVMYVKSKAYAIKYPTANKQTEYVMPASVVSMAANIFENATYLEKVTMPNVMGIPDNAFTNSGVKEVVASRVRTIGYNAFMNTNLTSFDFTNVTVIYANAFRNTKLAEVDFTDALEFVDTAAFAYCTELKKITISANAPEFNFSSIFEGCTGIEEVIIDEEYEYLVEENDFIMDLSKTLLFYSFNDSEEIVVPEGIIYIGANAFAGNTHVKSVVLPSTLKQIGSKAFYGCENLEKVTFLSEKAPDLLGFTSEGRTLTYENFVHHIEDGQTNIAVYCKVLNASYNNYLFRTYFKSLNEIEG